MFNHRSNSRHPPRITTSPQAINSARSNIRTNSRSFTNIDLDTQDDILLVDNNVRVRTGKIKLVTKFIIATLSSLGLSISVYILIPSIPTYLSANLAPALSKLQPVPSTIDKSPPKLPSKSEPPTEAKLQNIAYNIMQSNDWDAQKLHYFKQTWLGLNIKQQTSAKETVWYQMFERALTLETNSALKNLTDDDQTYSPRVRALLSLGLNLDIPKSSNKNNTPNREENNNVEKLAKKSVRSSKNSGNNVVARTQSAVQTISRNEPVFSQKRNENKVLASSKARNVQKKQLKRPTHSELSDITVQFVDAYESGNLKKFAALFAKNAISNKQNDIVGIKEQYAQIFSSTTERQMFIHDLKWSFKKNAAIGKGKLELVVLSNNEPDVLSQKGRVEIVAERQNNKVLIKRFYHLTE